MYVDGPYREWADFLNDQKCGGKPEPEPFTVEIGEVYKVHWCSSYEGMKTVTAENKEWFEKIMNDPYNDTYWFEKVNRPS